jgi:hypothetical protein
MKAGFVNVQTLSVPGGLAGCNFRKNVLIPMRIENHFIP